MTKAAPTGGGAPKAPAGCGAPKGAPADVTCRLMRAGDEAAVAALSGELGYPSTAAEIESRKAALDRQGTSAVYVAEDAGGAVVGWIFVVELTSIEAEPYGEIRGLVVGESARSRGVGALLTAVGEAWARERGLREIAVRSNVVRERAHEFYRRLGYEEQKKQVKLKKRLL